MRSKKQQHTLSRGRGWRSAVQHIMNGHSHVCVRQTLIMGAKGGNTGNYGRRAACRPRAPGDDTHTCVYDRQTIMFVCRWGNKQTNNNDQRHKRSRRGSSSAKPPKTFLHCRSIESGGRLCPCRTCGFARAGKQRGLTRINTVQRSHR